MAGYDGNGNFFFTYSWANDSANGIPITASRMDGQFNDAVSGFDLCITRDGQGAPTVAIPFPGVADASAAALGYVGEFVSSTVLAGSAVFLTTGVTSDITSISLTAGDWDVEGTIVIAPAGTISSVNGWASSVSATAPTLPNSGGMFALGITTNNTLALPIGRRRFSLASTTTVYLSTNAAFSSTAGAYGFIGARRAR
jgi:hypothetical protein